MKSVREQLQTIFVEQFGDDGDTRLFFAPGRVNVLGEHIDYNGGKVLPCALTLGTYALVRKNNKGLIRLVSANFDKRIETAINGISYKSENDWGNYPLSVVDVFNKQGFKSDGFDMAVCGTIPNGSGLSSSASIELLTAIVISTLFNHEIDRVRMIQLCQKAENEFVGVHCGIMDQFAIGMGKKDNLILLDCDSLDYRHIPFFSEPYTLLIANTNKKRSLSDSKYNERRRECDEALAILKQHTRINTLCDLDSAAFEALSAKLENPALVKRVRHAVTENERVILASKLVAQNASVAELGEQLNRSHDSLRDDYEVTGKELDTLVSEIRKIDGVAGARMTGAGFGGCAVALARIDAINEIKKRVSLSYREKIGYPPSFYDVAIGDGPGEINW